MRGFVLDYLLYRRLVRGRISLGPGGRRLLHRQRSLEFGFDDHFGRLDRFGLQWKFGLDQRIKRLGDQWQLRFRRVFARPSGRCPSPRGPGFSGGLNRLRGLGLAVRLCGRG
jgi:hypothetical protein